VRDQTAGTLNYLRLTSGASAQKALEDAGLSVRSPERTKTHLDSQILGKWAALEGMSNQAYRDRVDKKYAPDVLDALSVGKIPRALMYPESLTMETRYYGHDQYTIGSAMDGENDKTATRVLEMLAGTTTGLYSGTPAKTTQEFILRVKDAHNFVQMLGNSENPRHASCPHAKTIHEYGDVTLPTGEKKSWDTTPGVTNNLLDFLDRGTVGRPLAEARFGYEQLQTRIGDHLDIGRNLASAQMEAMKNITFGQLTLGYQPPRDSQPTREPRRGNAGEGKSAERRAAPRHTDQPRDGLCDRYQVGQCRLGGACHYRHEMRQGRGKDDERRGDRRDRAPDRRRSQSPEARRSNEPHRDEKRRRY
jgi:hypothetical protein